MRYFTSRSARIKVEAYVSGGAGPFIDIRVLLYLLSYDVLYASKINLAPYVSLFVTRK